MTGQLIILIDVMQWYLLNLVDWTLLINLVVIINAGLHSWGAW